MEQNNKQVIKALVVMKNMTDGLLIDEGWPPKASYRLPKLTELDPAVLSKSEKHDLSDDLVLVLTDQEISPWDLLSPFPPPGYNDYGYMNLVQPAGDSWENLNSEDKSLIQENLTKQKLIDLLK
jgi:hypothetical protein